MDRRIARPLKDCRAPPSASMNARQRRIAGVCSLWMSRTPMPPTGSRVHSMRVVSICCTDLSSSGGAAFALSACSQQVHCPDGSVATRTPFTKRQLGSGIYLVRFDNQYALALTFLRIQEHYESSHFRHRVFSLEDYMDWYAARFGAFTYFEDWSGFNVPSTAFEPFYAGRFDPLLRKEQQLLFRFRNVKPPYYVIGLYRDQELTHELAHALFFTRPAYRSAVLAAMREYDTTGIVAQLASLGYHRRVLQDEVHAYLIAGGAAARRPANKLVPLRRTLRAIYREHSRDLHLRYRTTG
jgi:hypothetical protein